MAEATMPAAPVPSRELSFGQALEKPPSKIFRAMLGAVVAVAVVGGSYWLYAWSAGTPDAAVPKPPAGPASLVKPPPKPVPVPTEDQINAMFPPVAPRPAPPSDAPASVETPGDRNQLN